jgi:ubiquinone biosynthesis accessory factor UbiK
MPNAETLDEITRKIGKAIEASPAKDLQKNVKALLQSNLARLDLVTRDEFALQTQLLLRTREKLEAMEARVTELEALRPQARSGS